MQSTNRNGTKIHLRFIQAKVGVFLTGFREIGRVTSLKHTKLH